MGWCESLSHSKRKCGHRVLLTPKCRGNAGMAGCLKKEAKSSRTLS